LWQAINWFYAFLPGGDQIYMVGISAVCWSIWNVRNRVTFDGHVMQFPTEAIFVVCSFLIYWAGLQLEEIKELMVQGSEKLMRMAAEFTKRIKTGPARLTAGNGQ
jgi:hypothetical protein